MSSPRRVDPVVAVLVVLFVSLAIAYVSVRSVDDPVLGSTSSSGNVVTTSPTSTSSSTTETSLIPPVSIEVERTTTTVHASRSATRTEISTTTEAPPPADGPVFLGSFRVTCYQRRGTTKSGAPAGPGSIAVDRRVIPLGTRLELEGLGRGTATDTGSAIVGNKLDLWRSDCSGWPNPTVRVWRLSE